MAGNIFGNVLRVTTFGESHGAMIGAVIDGFPAGITIDQAFVASELQRRRPGQSHISTQRKEVEEFNIVSGVFEGKSLGTPIAILIPNADTRSTDYDHLKDVYRPNHADFTYHKKYGHRDHRGGGRSSARETAARVAAGSIAEFLLRDYGVECVSFVSSIGSISTKINAALVKSETVESNIVRCPDENIAKRMITEVEAAKKAGDSLGGIITGVIHNCPVGLGEPVFNKLSADLAAAMMGINAVKGFEIGAGFSAAKMCGSEHNDIFVPSENGISTTTNNSGGIQGGISNGMDIEFRVAFKPVATIMQSQTTVNADGETVQLNGKGRHDPCVVPRAVAIVDAMSRLVIADHLLMQRMQNNG